MTKAEAWDYYKRRAFQHRADFSQRQFAKNYERIGFEGEWAFAQALHIDIDLSERPYGDRGIDFVVGGKKVDIKSCSSSAANAIAEEMWVEVGKCRNAVIYVMATYLERRKGAIIVGWEHGDFIKKYPREESPWGVENYCCPWYALKHPWYLYETLGLEV